VIDVYAPAYKEKERHGGDESRELEGEPRHARRLIQNLMHGQIAAPQRGEVGEDVQNEDEAEPDMWIDDHGFHHVQRSVACVAKQTANRAEHNRSNDMVNVRTCMSEGQHDFVGESSVAQSPN